MYLPSFYLNNLPVTEGIVLALEVSLDVATSLAAAISLVAAIPAVIREVTDTVQQDATSARALEFVLRLFAVGLRREGAVEQPDVVDRPACVERRVHVLVKKKLRKEDHLT